MSRYLYRVKRDVMEEEYAFLLRTLLAAEGQFGMAWRDQLEFGDSAVRLRADLQPAGIAAWRTDRWPGSVMIGHSATVYNYRSELAALEPLLRPGSLFGWMAPDYPEDLWFTNRAGELILVSVTHERDAWLLSADMVQAIGRRIQLSKERLVKRDEDYFERGLSAPPVHRNL